MPTLDFTTFDANDYTGTTGKPKFAEMVAIRAEIKTMLQQLDARIDNIGLPLKVTYAAGAQAGNQRQVNLANRQLHSVNFNANLNYILSSSITSGYSEVVIQGRNRSGLAKTVTLTPPSGLPIFFQDVTAANPQFIINHNTDFEIYLHHDFDDGYIRGNYGSRRAIGAGGGGGGSGGGTTLKTSIFQVTTPSDDGYFYGGANFNAGYPSLYPDTTGENITNFMLVNLVDGDALPAGNDQIQEVRFQAFSSGYNSSTNARNFKLKMENSGIPTAPTTIANFNSKTLTTAFWQSPDITDWTFDTGASVDYDLGTAGINMVKQILAGASAPVQKILLATYDSSGLGDINIFARDSGQATAPKLLVKYRA
jgi:hypothetical protein